MEFATARGLTDPRPRRWADMNELCRYLTVHRKTALRWVAAGMPSHQPIKGGQYLFDLDQVDEWIDSRCTSRAAGDVA